jgi:hypothetical protein
MKTGLLLGSLVLNIFLVALYITRPHEPAPRDGTISTPTNPDSSATAKADQPAVHFTTNVIYCDWRMMESSDYRSYIANLRAIGCPEQTIRDIIIADVNKLFEERAQQIGPVQDFDYWKAGTAKGPNANAERAQRHLALAQEKRALLKELLGIDFNDSSAILDLLNPLKAKYAFLTPEKQQQMLELEARYAARLAELSVQFPKDASNGPRYQELMAQKDAEIASLLDPQEREDYQLRYSRTAQRLRESFGAFDPAEHEFREIFRQQKSFDDRFGTSDANLAPEERDTRVAALAEKRTHLKAIMGEQRFSEYEHESWFQNSSLKDVAQKFNLSKEKAFQALDVTWLAQEQAMLIRASSGLSEQQRDETLLALRGQVEASLQQLLTAEGYAAYMKRRHGWMAAFPAPPGK